MRSNPWHALMVCGFPWGDAECLVRTWAKRVGYHVARRHRGLMNMSEDGTMVKGREELRARLLPVLAELRALLKTAPDKMVKKKLHWAVRAISTTVRFCEQPKTQPDNGLVGQHGRTPNPQGKRYQWMK